MPDDNQITQLQRQLATARRANDQATVTHLEAELRSRSVPIEEPPTRSIDGDYVAGDKVDGDKVLGDKIEQHYYPQPVRAPVVRPADRAALLSNVRRTWIDGVLKQSLWNDALITLGLAEQPNAVQRPYGLGLRAASGDGPLPQGTTIQQIYDAQDGALLILGQPGSGKTTLLLELAKTLLDRADLNIDHPIPVVFNLASWADTQPTIDAWLVAQLNYEYSVPKKIGATLVATGALLPLLDGLDEVAEQRRAACVTAINMYRAEHETGWAIPIVISCRAREYETLPPLQLRSAIMVQPLSHSEVDAYLNDKKQALAGVRAVVQDDPTLYELLETPLLLAVATLAFAGQAATTLRQDGDTATRRRVIFAGFVARQFEPPPGGKGVDARYSGAHTLRWLTWMGRQMQTHGEVVFRTDHLQPSWLVHRMQRWLHVTIALAVSLIGMLAVLPIAGLLVGWLAQSQGVLSLGRVTGLVAWLVVGLFGGLLAWLSFVIAGISTNVFLGDIVLFEHVRWSWAGCWVGLASWLLIALASVWQQETIVTLILGLVPAFVLALGVGLTTGKLHMPMRSHQGVWLSLQHAVRLGMLSAAPVIGIGLLGSLVLDAFAKVCTQVLIELY